MRSHLERRSHRPRPRLRLEALEDRQLLSAGGLLSALRPLGVIDSAPSSSAPALNTILAAPAPLLAPLTEPVVSLLAPATTAATDLLGGLIQPTASGGPASGAASGATGGLGLKLNLSVDLLFVHLDSVHLNVGLAPADQARR